MHILSFIFLHESRLYGTRRQMRRALTRNQKLGHEPAVISLYISKNVFPLLLICTKKIFFLFFIRYTFYLHTPTLKPQLPLFLSSLTTPLIKSTTFHPSNLTNFSPQEYRNAMNFFMIDRS